MRTRSHSPALSGPGRSQIEFETPSRPKPCTSPARRSIWTSPGDSPRRRPASCGQVGDCDRMAESERRLQVDEIRDGGQRAVQLACRQPGRQVRFGRDHGLPCRDRVKTAEDLLRPGAYQCRQRRIELPARPPAGKCGRTRDPADPVSHLHELGQLRDPRCHRHRTGLQRAGPAAAIPLLVRRADRLAYLARKVKLLSQRPGQPRMLGNHAVQGAVPGQGELESDPEPVQWRVARPDQPHGGQHRTDAAQFMGVFAGFEGDIVAKPFGLFVGVSVAADIDQQRRVVHRRPVLAFQACMVSEPKRDQALAQDVFHRLAEPQVHAE